MGLGCQPRVASTFTCGATLLVFHVVCWDTVPLWILLTHLGCRAVVQGSSCLQFPRAGMMGGCYPAWLVMCAEDLPSSPLACATGTLLTELFHQPQRVLSLVSSYRQGNRGAGILSRLHEIPEVPSDRNPSRVGNSHQEGNGHVKVGRREDYWRTTRWPRGKSGTRV